MKLFNWNCEERWENDLTFSITHVISAGRRLEIGHFLFVHSWCVFCFHLLLFLCWLVVLFTSRKFSHCTVLCVNLSNFEVERESYAEIFTSSIEFLKGKIHVYIFLLDRKPEIQSSWSQLHFKKYALYFAGC